MQLVSYPPGPVRNRLLARLAHDVEPTVSRGAQAGLAEAPDAAAWMAGGAAEVEADGALFHNKYGEAVEYMEQALNRYPKGEPGPGLKLAWLQGADGRREVAQATLKALSAQYPDDPRVAVTMQWPVSRPRLLGHGFEFEVVSKQVAYKVLRGQWSFLSVTIRNPENQAWPGLQVKGTYAVRATVRDGSGKDVSLQPVWDIAVSMDPVVPGGEVVLQLPFRAPAQDGKYEVLIHPVILPPFGTPRVGPPQSALPFEVVRKL